MKLFDDDLHESTLLGDQGAVFSSCRQYRYFLYRTWQAPHPEEDCALAVVGLNPSTADAFKDDNTIRKLIKFAKRDGFTRLWMLNAGAYRATDPRTMKKQLDPAGPHNEAYLKHYTNLADATLCCWGANVDEMEEVFVLNAWRAIQRPTFCLGLTGSGMPKHPLYMPDSTPFMAYNQLPI